MSPTQDHRFAAMLRSGDCCSAPPTIPPAGRLDVAPGHGHQGVVVGRCCFQGAALASLKR